MVVEKHKRKTNTEKENHIQEKEKIANLIGQTYKPSRMELYERRNDNGKNVSSDNSLEEK